MVWNYLEEFDKNFQKTFTILQFKLDILWTICDALYLAYELKRPPYFNVGKIEFTI